MASHARNVVTMLGRSGAYLRLFIVAAPLCAAMAGAAHAQVVETVILNFDVSNGGDPFAPLFADSSGPSGALRGLYGTTTDETGNLFRLAPPKAGKADWKFSQLWVFKDSGSEPAAPGIGALFAFTKRTGPQTPLYGVTEFGGSLNHACINDYQGCGVIYSLAGGSLTTLYAFTGGSDGGEPADGVIADKSGALYTTSSIGGGAISCGTVIRLTPPAQGQTAWSESTLWTFTGGSDGCAPGALTIDASGALYGSAAGGGISDNGTVFKLSPPAPGGSAWTEQTLWTFQGGSDGTEPSATSLTFGKGGVLYGTTFAGGSAGDGIVFQLTPPRKGEIAWNEAVVWSFTGGSDGASPIGSVILDKAGMLYGTAYAGGVGTCNGFAGPGCGTAFKLKPPGAGQAAWTETTLWTFSGGGDGGSPGAALTSDKRGVLYGTASAGGSTNDGVVFSLGGTGFAP